MLSGKELFRYKNQQEKTVPEKGGQKDYEPDGSWLQDKQIENFHQARQRALSEPRVTRKYDLVRGEWNADKKLVELTREMRNFWEVMGFNEKNRKWLYPEEALFLIETTVIQVWYECLPLTIQEAYSILLDGTISLEYYQVYAHLRRIGYVVIRHQGRQQFTKYERQIGLDKQKMSRKKNKSSEKTKENNGDLNKSTETTNTDKDANDKRTDDMEVIEEISNTNQSENEETVNVASSSENHSINIEDGNTDKIVEKMDTGEDVVDSDKTVVDCTDIIHDACEKLEENIKDVDESVNDKVGFDKVGLDKTCFDFSEVVANNQNGHGDKAEFPVSKWNFNNIEFPNFAIEGEVVKVTKPDTDFAPVKCDLAQGEYSFMKCDYVNKKIEKRKGREQKSRLKFSRPEFMDQLSELKKTCRSWSEFKTRRKELEQRERSKDVSRMYGEGLHPLVDPLKASSTAAILSQLHVIEDYPIALRGKDRPAILPDFDVYSPSTKYRKTTPGTPDFRVMIFKSREKPPDLGVIADVFSYLNDDVTLNYALVSCGEVVFYTAGDFTLPIDIAM